MAFPQNLPILCQRELPAHAMATILELANYAGLPAETVLRVILREPVNEDAQRRVAAAIEALGPPAYPRPDGSIEVLPPDILPPETSGAAMPAVPERDDTVPGAARSELAHIVEFQDVCRAMIAQLKRDRRERIEDLELVTDLLTASWRGVDRRLGRLEKVIARIDEARRDSASALGRTRPTPNVIRFEPRSAESQTPEMDVDEDARDAPSGA